MIETFFICLASAAFIALVYLVWKKEVAETTTEETRHANIVKEVQKASTLIALSQGARSPEVAIPDYLSSSFSTMAYNIGHMKACMIRGIIQELSLRGASITSFVHSGTCAYVFGKLVQDGAETAFVLETHLLGLQPGQIQGNDPWLEEDGSLYGGKVLLAITLKLHTPSECGETCLNTVHKAVSEAKELYTVTYSSRPSAPAGKVNILRYYQQPDGSVASAGSQESVSRLPEVVVNRIYTDVQGSKGPIAIWAFLEKIPTALDANQSLIGAIIGIPGTGKSSLAKQCAVFFKHVIVVDDPTIRLSSILHKSNPEEPTLLIVEDAHLHDPASIGAVNNFISGVSDSRNLSILMTWDPSCVVEGSDLDKVLKAYCRAGRCNFNVNCGTLSYTDATGLWTALKQHDLSYAHKELSPPLKEGEELTLAQFYSRVEDKQIL